MPRPTPYPLLLIDAGNSTVKFGVVARPGAAPRLVRKVPTANLNAALAKRIGAKAERVVIASVVPSASLILRGAFPRAKFIGPRTVLGFTTCSDRRTVGADRLANVAALRARHGGNALAVSFGTAATFDLVDAQGVHRGGAIAPGWASFARLLSEQTAQLSAVGAAKAKRFIGRNTREAMVAGVAGGYEALVLRLIEEMKNEAGLKKMHVVFTGGDAPAVASLLPSKVVCDPLLTLRGIAVLAEGIAREASK